MNAATIYYVRHGESTADLARQLSYRVDGHALTERGVEQARRLAEFLAVAPGPCSPVFSSPLQRAVQTAQIVAERVGAEVRVVEAFRGFDVGLLDGRGDEDAWGTYESVVRAWWDGDLDAEFPGGEGYGQVLERLRHGLSEVVLAAGRGPAVVVGHGGIMKAAVADLLPGTTPPQADLAACTISELALRIQDEELTGSLVCWSQQAELAALRPGTGRRRAEAVQQGLVELS